MKLHSLMRNLCLIASFALLVLVYGRSPYWPVLIAGPAMLLFWVLAKRRAASWRASALLCSYLGLAVAAVLIERPPLPIELGCVAALIWWDLQDSGLAQAGQIPGKGTNLSQKYRLQSLALTAGASLLLAGIGVWLQLRLPFGVIALLVLLVTGCCVYAVRILRTPPLSGE